MLNGGVLIGGRSVQGGIGVFRAINPATGKQLEPLFAFAGAAEVEDACNLAWDAFRTFRNTSLEVRAAFLESIAANILDLGDALVERACAETGLPRARIEGERARTIAQLKLFAELVRGGEWLGIRVDPAMPSRTPLPRPDLRMRNIGVGPVGVFGASNFPLAFSVAGGDTASALAAGCPVIVKGHTAHPGTSELVGRAVQKAVASSQLPSGVFSLLLGEIETGSLLIMNPYVKAVGFTGSRGGGMGLVRLAASREEPIPVYAEMSSINPVYLLPAALSARAEPLGQDFVASLTMGAGQFCTNPGLIFGVAGPDLDRFIAASAEVMKHAPPQAMLTPSIHRAYESGLEALAQHDGVETVARGCAGSGPNQGTGAIFATDARTFRNAPRLSQEVFGSSSIIVRCQDTETMFAVSRELEGQLTATLQMDDGDTEIARQLLSILELKAGRILANGWPTGVEVAPAMVHGGPFPATSDGRTTSVGTMAIQRFLRPVCYQNLISSVLPEELRDDWPSPPSAAHRWQADVLKNPE